jgi:hypothetical protein
MNGLRPLLLAAACVFSACGQESPPESEAPPVTESPEPAQPPPQPVPPPAAEPTPPPAPAAEAESEERDRLARLQQILTKVQAGLELAQALQAVVEGTAERTGEIPETFDDAATRSVQPTSPDVRSVNLTDGGLIVVDYVGEAEFPGGTIELKPMLGDAGVTWDCSGGTLPAEYRPEDCG